MEGVCRNWSSRARFSNSSKVWKSGRFLYKPAMLFSNKFKVWLPAAWQFFLARWAMSVQRDIPQCMTQWRVNCKVHSVHFFIQCCCNKVSIGAFLNWSCWTTFLHSGVGKLPVITDKCPQEFGCWWFHTPYYVVDRVVLLIYILSFLLNYAGIPESYCMFCKSLLHCSV